MKWNYDNTDGRYYIEGARISFTNFSGIENDYNREGSKNFKLQIDEALYNELVAAGVHASCKPPRNDDEDSFYSVKVGVYKTTDVYCLTNRAKSKVEFDNLSMIDRLVTKGDIMNGSIDLSFKVSINTKLSRPAYYLRADEIYIPLKESRFSRKYEHYGEDDDAFDE